MITTKYKLDMGKIKGQNSHTKPENSVRNDTTQSESEHAGEIRNLSSNTHKKPNYAI